MPLSPDRIITPGQTPHAHERDAFDFVVRELPDTDPYRLWAFVDLIDKSGRRYDIDLLIVGYHALYVVEVKSHVGTLTGDEIDWQVTFPDGGRTVLENPLRATNLKAKVLGSLLDERFARDPDARARQLRRPWVQPLVFLSGPNLKVNLTGPGGMYVVTRETFVRAITRGEFPGATENLRDHVVNRPVAGATQRLLKDMGLRPSIAALKVQDLILRELLEDGTHYQDHLGVHQSIANLKRRVRSFIIPANTTAERRERLLRAAGREARHLTALSDHRNILRLISYTPEGPLGGPCVILEHIEGALPLDAFLRANPNLAFEDKLAIIQQIAEALEFCHRKQIVHRGLSPRAVLVRRAGETTGPFEVRLYNFQLAAGEETSGTTHLESAAPVYVAPEVLENPAAADAASDVFSLGAIAYLVLTGQPPGNTLAERAALLSSGQLSVAAARDDLAGGFTRRSLEDPFGGVPSAEDDSTIRLRSLDEVVGFATEVNRHARADSAIAWLNLLLDTATMPAAKPDAPYVSPLQAGPGQRLAEDLEVIDILGKGSTARVLRVRRDGTDYALKVALSPELGERLEQEARVLQTLHKKVTSDRIVSLVEKLDLGGGPCLLMTDAGESLATLIAREGPPSLDFARRWGKDLLDALEALEDRGVQHRDIKPANLGVLSGQAKKKRSLMLFDFSLAGAADTAITGGTPAYRDPFLDRRGRWDAAADRWAAAMSLHELLTGVRPGWGDGTETAAASEGDIRIAAERFDPSGNVRPKLTAFFRRALAREVGERFASADAMEVEWTGCFATLSYDSSPADAPVPSARNWDFSAVEPGTPIAALPLSARAKNAIDRAGMTVLSELLQMPRNRLSTTRGIGRHTHQEIQRFVEDARTALGQRLELAAELPFFAGFRDEGTTVVGQVPGLPLDAAAALEDAGLAALAAAAAAPRAQVERVLVPFSGAVDILRARLQAVTTGGGPLSGEPATIEDWLEQLFARQGKREKYLTTAAQLLGVEPWPGGASPATRDARGLARALDVTQAAVHIAFSKAREHWKAHPHLPALQARLERTLERLSSVAPLARVAAELVTSDLPHRSPIEGTSANPGGPDVTAEALARIAAETHPDVVQGRIHDRPWIASGATPLALARELGRRADDLAQRVPLPSSEEVRDALTPVVGGTALAALPQDRLVALAAEASARAARSARLELYPRHLEARRALELSASAIGPQQATPEAIRQIVRARYPEAEPPPEGEALHVLMESLQFKWDPAKGSYTRPGAELLTSLDTLMAVRQSTTHTSHRLPPSNKENQEALEFEARLRLAVDKRSFRVLDVTAGFDEDAAKEIGRRFNARIVSLDGEVIAEMDRLAVEKQVDAALIEQTDREGPAATDDWANLCVLMREAAGRAIDRALAGDATSSGAPHGPLVLTQPGILARYHLEDVLGNLVQHAQRDDAPAIFLINPTDDASEWARIDSGTKPLVVPLPSQAQRLKVPRPWIDNWHRGGAT